MWLRRQVSVVHLFALRSRVFKACSLEMLSGMCEMELLLQRSSTSEVHPPMPSGSPPRVLWDASATVSLHGRLSM